MIAVDKAHLFVAARSHPGMSGKANEDRYLVAAYQLKKFSATPAVLAVVTDGIGGHRGGEVAAEIAVNVIRQVVSGSNGSRPVEILRQALLNASQAIYQKAGTDQNLQGMGTTCACTWIIGDRLYTSSVGDSRIYLIRDGHIQQLTTDHTWIQEALDQGLLTAEQARSHPNAHVIRRYLGSRNLINPDTRLRLKASETNAQAEANQGCRLRPGDQILLCSDGLTDLVAEAEILAMIKDGHSAKAIDQLVDLANQRGGHDNITVVTLGIPQATAKIFRRTNPWRKVAWAGLMAAAAATVILAALTGIKYLERSRPEPTAPPVLTHQVTAAISPTVRPVLGSRPTEPTRTPRVSPTATPTQGWLASLTPWPTNTAAP